MQNTISYWQQQISSRKISATELAKIYLDKINSTAAGQINAFINVNQDLTLLQAKEADELLAKNSQANINQPLMGLPIAHKDVFVTKNWPSTAGSKMLANYISPFNATVVQKLQDCGMVCLGKTNMDEFAMGSSNEHSYFGNVSNPWAADYVPGGSSGGSAAAVAAGLTLCATGSDTGGSIRQPASFCGISGIKPTYGSISRYGMIAYASSLDQAGVFANTANDCAILLKALIAKDFNDSTSIEHHGFSLDNLDKAWGSPSTSAKNSQKPLQYLNIGIPQQFIGDIQPDVQNAINQAIKQLQQLGANIIDIDLPLTKASIPVYYVIAAAQASSNLSRYDGVRYGFRADDYTDLSSMYKKSRSQGLGEEVKKRIMVGSYVLSNEYYEAYYLKALKIRRLITQDFINAFNKCDIILGPVSPTTAWKKGSFDHNPEHMYLADIFTLGASLAGLPCMSIPCGFSSGPEVLPIGMQLITKHFAESDILQLANIYQNHTDWHTKNKHLNSI